MDNYKGIYYNESKEQKYFEGGAHFRYKDLYKTLMDLGGIMPEDNYNNTSKNNENSDKILSLSNLLQKAQEKKINQKTRNINHFNYANNPNTQITFNKNSASKTKYLVKKNSCNNHSRNVDNNFFFDEANKNYTNVNTFSFNNNKKSFVKNNMTQNLILEKGIILESEEKTNNLSANKKYIHLKNLKNEHNRNRSDVFIKNIKNISQDLKEIKKYNKNNVNQNIRIKNNKILIPKYNLNKNNCNNNSKYSNTNNVFNKCINILLNVKKSSYNVSYGKNKNYYLKDKINTGFITKNNYNKYISQSKNKIKQNYIRNKRNFGNKNDINNNGKYINDILRFTQNKITNKLKNSSSEFNVNKHMTKTMNNKRSFQGNNLSAKKEINISSNNDLFKQKYTKKNINQIRIYNQINNLGKNSHKNLSRNINNMKSFYNAQSIKFITSSEINDINKLVNRK
jgi:hypothetical protein